MAYDAALLVHEKVTTGKTSGANWAALTADVASIAVPMAVGAGIAARAAYKSAKILDKATDAAKVADKVKDVAETGSKTKGGVYSLRDADDVVKRTGRTTDLGARKAQHKLGKETKDLTFKPEYKTDKYTEQRGLEDKIYNQHKVTAKTANGGLNKSKAIRDNNPNIQEYQKAADEFIRRGGQ